MAMKNSKDIEGILEALPPEACGVFVVILNEDGSVSCGALAEARVQQAFMPLAEAMSDALSRYMGSAPSFFAHEQIVVNEAGEVVARMPTDGPKT
jgi:hypothetical protein